MAYDKANLLADSITMLTGGLFGLGAKYAPQIGEKMSAMVAKKPEELPEETTSSEE